MTTPADEMRAAAWALRDVAPLVKGPLAGLADPLAAWLDSAAEDAEQIGADHRALTVARQINGPTP
ncbi:hypothetical protein [Streptomyces scopuliridis]|uniref:hypothetical protein n=1 Tax=Streptomyces scopuliridis TaxID=452529 RepID=UPI0036D19828